MGTRGKRRDRTTRGRMWSFLSSHAQQSSSAMMWQAQEQKNRPKIALPTNSVAMSRKPAVTIPASSVYITSLSSRGARVVPLIVQWAMWMPISTYTDTSVSARHLPYFEERAAETAVGPCAEEREAERGLTLPAPTATKPSESSGTPFLVRPVAFFMV